jgi:ketosteroid isomerase-like protein
MPRDDAEAAERLRAAYDTWNDGGLDAVAAAHWHPDIDLEVPVEWAVILGGQQFAGREAVVGAYRHATASIQDSRIELLGLDQGDDGEFLATIRFTGRGSSSGVTVESPEMFQVVLMAGGLVRRIRLFADRAAAAAAVGLRT